MDRARTSDLARSGAEQGFDRFRRQAMVGMAAFVAGSGLGHAALSDSGSGLKDVITDAVNKLAPDRAVPLKLLMPNGSGASLEPVAKAFEVAVGIRVELQEVPFDNIGSQLLLDKMRGETSVDVALPATFAVPDLVSAEVIRPLDQYRDAYEPQGFRDDILFNVGDSFEGKTYGFQTDGDAYIMFYHGDMLNDRKLQARYEDKFGMPLTIPLTWNELDQQMAFFHAPNEGRFGGAMMRTQDMVAWEWWIRLHAKGVWPLSPDMSPQFAGNEGVEAVEEMIRASSFQAPEVWQNSMFENWSRYARGDVYCTIGWGGTQKFVNQPGKAVRGLLDYGPAPGGLVNGELLLTPYFNWGWNYVVTTATLRPELAYLFCLFAASPAMSTLAVRQSGSFFDPFRPEHYRDPEIQAAYSIPFLTVQRQSLESAIPDLYLRGQSEYFRVLGKGLMEALRGEVSPSQSLQHVAQMWDMITSRYGRKQQQAGWAALRTKYPQNAQRILRDLSI